MNNLILIYSLQLIIYLKYVQKTNFMFKILYSNIRHITLQPFGLQSAASSFRKLNASELERLKAPAFGQRNREIPQTQWPVTQNYWIDLYCENSTSPVCKAREENKISRSLIR